MTLYDSNLDLDQLKKIMQLNFAVTELVLFLDTHPENREALNLHNNFSSDLAREIESYQEKYGPLTPSSPGADFPWQWIDEPWPWQIQY